jgi:TPR repeat protein
LDRGARSVPDIFISHKAEEADAAARLVRRLKELGYDVWSAAALNAGEHFESEITARLDASRAVVVLWSTKAIDSEWVRAEAEAARRRGIVVPAVIDDVSLEKLPLLYRNMHISDLRGWQGGKTHTGYKQLVAAIAELIGQPSAEAAKAGAAVAAANAAEDSIEAEDVDENELWDDISQNAHQSADEYKSYLKRFGENGRYAELARLRIRRLEREAAHQRWNWGYVGSAIVALGGLFATVFAFIQWVGENPEAAKWVGNLIVTEEQRLAQKSCAAWYDSQAIRSETLLPPSNLSIIDICENAAGAFGASGDIKAILSLAYIGYSLDNDEKARQAVEAADAQRSPLAQLAKGYMYAQGRVYAVDTLRASDALRKAADGGVGRADGFLCQWGIGNNGTIAGDTRGAAFYCERGSGRGDAMAQSGLAYLLQYGLAGTQDLTESLKLFETAAAEGYGGAQFRLGLIKLYGIGSERDTDEAIKLIQQSASQGFIMAERTLGVVYECGLGVDVDMAAAGKHYDNAIAQQDNVAGYLMGLRPLRGPNSESPTETQDTLDLINYLPDCEAGRRLIALQYPVIGNPNFSSSMALSGLGQSAATGNAISEYVLGDALLYGYYDVPSVDEAFAHHKISADAGVMQAQFRMGEAYQYGRGADANIPLAAEYYRKASAQGMPGAADQLRSLGSAAVPSSAPATPPQP